MESKSFFVSNDKALCCGCRACEKACPSSAIVMKGDDEGFSYPVIQKDKCINCGICKKVCPVSSERDDVSIRNIYTVQNKDKQSLLNSSSGGVFISLAKFVISGGGKVFGAVMNDNYETVITSADNTDELRQMQGSKYVSSDTADAFVEVEKYLKDNIIVLFTGSPCQIAGLRSYLRKDYDNLYTMDFLCHGMPSQKMFSENIKYLSDKYKGKISDYKFRDKSLKGWGHVTSFYVDGKKHYEAGRLNAYFCGFIKNYLNRYSCYSCHFTGEKRCSDITVGDFWGCNDSSFSLKKGVSFAAINTQKGEELFEKIKDDFLCKSTTSEIVSEYNGTLLSSHNQNIPDIRKNIYAELDKCGYKHIVKRYLTPEKKILLQAKMRMDMLLNKIGK